MNKFSDTHIAALEALKDVVKAFDGKRIGRYLNDAMEREIKKRKIPCICSFSMDEFSTQFDFYSKGDDGYKHPDDKGSGANVYGDDGIWIDAEYTNKKIDKIIEAERKYKRQVPYARIGIY